MVVVTTRGSHRRSRSRQQAALHKQCIQSCSNSSWRSRPSASVMYTRRQKDIAACSVHVRDAHNANGLRYRMHTRQWHANSPSQFERDGHSGCATKLCSLAFKLCYTSLSTRSIHPVIYSHPLVLMQMNRILGKYGGVPAIGSGLVLPRPSKDMILKATASPAAREIQYSRVENRDACDLAQVMRFKARKSGAGAGEVLPGESPEGLLSAWIYRLQQK